MNLTDVLRLAEVVALLAGAGALLRAAARLVNVYAAVKREELAERRRSRKVQEKSCGVELDEDTGQYHLDETAVRQDSPPPHVPRRRRGG